MKKYIFLFFLSISCLPVIAQDPQYSQFYANALYLSPAFSGAHQNTRGIVISRYQWPSQSASFFSYTASLDHYFERYKSGVGLIVHTDVATAAPLRTTEIGIQYSYKIQVTPKHTFVPGIQLSYGSKNIETSRLTFGSQYTNDGFVGGSSNEGIQNSVNYVDISSGGLFYSENYWVGISAHHMNRPYQSFLNNETELLPMKLSLVGGYKFQRTSSIKRSENSGDEKSISPTFIYKMQGKSDQLDIGLYGRYTMLVAGIWYRGIPVKVYHSERSNHDALVFLLGMIYKSVSVGYSYDLTISKLTSASGGSHEISISYHRIQKKKRHYKILPCPEF